jgi:short-subunit dehydrogenase
MSSRHCQMLVYAPAMASTALVTGASSGIGEEFARQLAGRGYDVILVARRADRLERIAAELPTSAHVIPCDLATEADTLASKVAALGLEVDLLVNNAGYGTFGRFIDIEEGRDAGQVRINCEAVVILTRAFLPGMVARGRGGIINVASNTAFQPIPYWAVYAASKAFVLHFTEALHVELRGTGVRCLALAPSAVETEWHDVAGVERIAVPGKIQPDSAVREALDGFEKDRRVLVPGGIARWMTRAGALAPRSVQLRVLEKMYRRDAAGS